MTDLYLTIFGEVTIMLYLYRAWTPAEVIDVVDSDEERIRYQLW